MLEVAENVYREGKHILSPNFLDDVFYFFKVRVIVIHDVQNEWLGELMYVLGSLVQDLFEGEILRCVVPFFNILKSIHHHLLNPFGFQLPGIGSHRAEKVTLFDSVEILLGKALKVL